MAINFLEIETAQATLGLSAFMKFWKTVNDILRSRDLPEMQYGEAKDWWTQHQALS